MIKRLSALNIFVLILFLLMLSIAGCTQKKDSKDTKTKSNETSKQKLVKEDVVELVLVPEKEWQSIKIPKIADKLGKGSLAIIKKDSILEILNPAGKLVARGRLDKNIGLGPWSPEGNVLTVIHSRQLKPPYTRQQSLRALDFPAGKNHNIHTFDLDKDIGKIIWADNFSMWLSVSETVKGPYNLYSADLSGTPAERQPLKIMNKNIRYHEVDVLDTYFKHNDEGGVEERLALLALHGENGGWLGILKFWNEVNIVSPAEIKYFNSAVFSPDSDKIAFTASGDFGIGIQKEAVSDVYITNISKTEQLTRTEPPGFALHSFTPDGKGLIIYNWEGKKKATFLLDIETRERTEIISSDKSVVPLGFTDEGKSLIAKEGGEDEKNPGKLLKIDMKDFKAKTIATDVVHAVLAENF